MNEYLRIWHQIKEYLSKRYATCECDFDPFFEELEYRKSKEVKEMKKHRIRVYDYYDAYHGGNPQNAYDNADTKIYEVDAWCVGGATGIHAFFILDDRVCFASGDDGFWTFTGRMGKQWVSRYKEAFDELAKEVGNK
jgi:hypothetical protein